MAGERITLDPVSESTANAPLELHDPDNGLFLLEHAYPVPEEVRQWAESADTEGARLASRRPPNRPIPVKVRVAEPQDPAATNLCTNPSLEIDLTGWTSGVEFGRTRSSDVASRGDYSLKSTYDGAGTTDTNCAAYAFTAPAAGLITASVDIWIPSSYDGSTAPRIALESFTGMTGATTGVADLSLRDRWQRITCTGTAVSGDLTGSAVIRCGTTYPSSSATGVLYVDGLCIGSAVFFDGDSAGCRWTGSRHASTSTRPAPGGARFEAILSDLRQKVGKLREEKGTYRRVKPSGDVRIFDLEAVDYDEPTDKRTLARRVAEVTLTFTALPLARAAEVTLTDHPEATLPAVIFTETDIAGAVPALGRMELPDASGRGTSFVIWGVRSRNYSAAATAQLYYESSDAMWTLAGGAASAADAAASGGSVVRQTALTTSFVTQMSASGLTHVGAYRVIARVGAPPNAGVVEMRLGWTYGTRAQYIDNAPVVVPDTFSGSLFYLVDLGQISIPAPLPGRSMEWGPRIQARSSSAGDDLSIDYLLLIPIDESSGQTDSTLFDLGASPVIEPSAKGEARHDGFYRQKAASSTVWGRIPIEGDNLLIPPAGSEKRTLQIIVKPARALLNVGDSDDAVIPSVSVKLSYTARFLV